MTSQAFAYVTLVIAALGAVLGTLSFINQYLVRFKAKVFVNNYFRIQIGKSHGYLRAESVTLNLSISNSKNSYGIIKDLTLGLYQTSETTPRYSFLFPAEMSESGKTFVPFTPLILPPKTFKTIFIRFSPKEFEQCLLNSMNIDLDLLCFVGNSKRWHRAEHIHLFHYVDNETNEPKFKIMNFEFSRERIKTDAGEPPTTFYQGNWGRWTFFLIHKTKYLIGLPGSIISQAILSPRLLVNVAASHIATKLVIGPVTRRMSSRRTTVTGGIVEPDDYTIASFNAISGIIKKTLPKFYQSSSVSTSFSDREIVLSRNGYQLSIYPQGDKTIASRGTSLKGQTINIEYIYAKSGLGFKYWTHAGRTMSRYRIAIQLLDYFYMFSSI